jgi:hypothetical protein
MRCLRAGGKRVALLAGCGTQVRNRHQTQVDKLLLQIYPSIMMSGPENFTELSTVIKAPCRGNKWPDRRLLLTFIFSNFVVEGDKPQVS